VVDIDGASGHRFIEALNLPLTRVATSSTKLKQHLYFDPPENGQPVPRTIRLKQDGKKFAVDVLGDGGYVVAPPSVHPDTLRPYAWKNADVPIVAFPEELLPYIVQNDPAKQAAPLPKIIDDGERDTLLTSLAGTMRRRGASQDAILAALREENATRVHPPLPDAQLRKIAKSIGAKAPAVLEEHLSDLGNARRFVTQHYEDVRSVMAWRNPWILFDGQRWTPDNTGHVERLAKQTVRRIYSEATRASDDMQRDQLLKHALRSESAPRIRAMLDLARTEPELSTVPRDLDANPWLFNVENGTVNLKTGQLKPHDREQLITRLAPVAYDPDATAPRWEQFLLEIMNGDAELVDFLQRAVGYALTGDIREQCLFFCYGQGSNGKSTFLETLRTLFGDYGQQSDFNTFLSSKSDGPRNDLARMQGARLVTASEADGEKGFDTRVVKLLTGDDTIVARRLYEEFFEFKPQHKLFLAANHKPIVKEQTIGFWRRMRLIPFTVSFSDAQRDKGLPRKLEREMSGILNWAIAGCQVWRKHGLGSPRAVQRATLSYREENDLLGEFISQRCVLNGEAWTSTPILYKAFTEWWVDTRGARSQPISLGWFGRLLSERPDLHQRKRKQMRGWAGITVVLNPINV
jgi:putative DNA primase/helicase